MKNEQVVREYLEEIKSFRGCSYPLMRIHERVTYDEKLDTTSALGLQRLIILEIHITETEQSHDVENTIIKLIDEMN